MINSVFLYIPYVYASPIKLKFVILKLYSLSLYLRSISLKFELTKINFQSLHLGNGRKVFGNFNI